MDVAHWPKITVVVLSEGPDFITFMGKTQFYNGKIYERQGMVRKPDALDEKKVSAYFGKRFQQGFFHWGVK